MQMLDVQIERDHGIHWMDGIRSLPPTPTSLCFSHIHRPLPGTSQLGH